VLEACAADDAWARLLLPTTTPDDATPPELDPLVPDAVLVADAGALVLVDIAPDVDLGTLDHAEPVQVEAPPVLVDPRPAVCGCPSLRAATHHRS
jgi:hypothetical protein